jgi:hypothetical protein
VTVVKRSRAIRVPVGLGADPHILFIAGLRSERLPVPTPEFSFAMHESPPRKFRWDYAWIDAKVALEVQGSIWTRGAHGRGTGILRDHEKFSLGAALGWRLLLCTPKELCSANTFTLIKRALHV